MATTWALHLATLPDDCVCCVHPTLSQIHIDVILEVEEPGVEVQPTAIRVDSGYTTVLYCTVV
jgi:hypothetical protein